MILKKLLTTALPAMLMHAALASAAPAADVGTPDEAVAMVKKAVTYYKANGKDKAFAAFNDPKGPFIDRDMYILVLDSNMVMVAHGANPRMIGKSVGAMKDADDKPFGKQFSDIGKGKGTGWIDYKWPNPVTKVIDAKSTYVEKVDDLLIGCGIYKK